MKFKHSFRVKAPLAKVIEFHQRSSSMSEITPPPIQVDIHQAPLHPKDGDYMDFTLKVGPFPIRWLARFENVTSSGFVDRQISGPFHQWVHQHKFTPIDDNLTEVTDRVSVRLRTNLIWGLVGLAMWLGLPFLFAYRGWKTRRLLESKM